MPRRNALPGGKPESFGIYYRQPTLQKPLLEFLDKADRPLLLREIAEGMGVKKTSLCNPLLSLSLKGLVTRWKVPATMYTGLGPKTTMMWLYQIVRDVENGSQQ